MPYAHAYSRYKLSKPINIQVTHLLFIDDLRIYVASEGKLQRVIKSTRH